MFWNFVLEFESFVFEYKNRIFKDQQNIGLVFDNPKGEVLVVLFHSIYRFEFAVFEDVQASESSGTVDLVLTGQEVGVQNILID